MHFLGLHYDVRDITHTNACDLEQRLQNAETIQEAAIDILRLLVADADDRLPQVENVPQTPLLRIFQEIAAEDSVPNASPELILQQALSVWTAAEGAQLVIEHLRQETITAEGATTLHPEITTLGPTSANLRPSSVAGSQLPDGSQIDLVQGKVDEWESFFLRVTQRTEEYCALWQAGHRICPWTHELKHVQEKHSGWVCDICSGSFAKTEGALTCRDCQWDVCFDCSDKHTTQVHTLLPRLDTLNCAIEAALQNTTVHDAPRSGVVSCAASLLQQRPGAKELLTLETILLLQAIAGNSHPSLSLAMTLHELGRVKSAQQDMQAAESLFQESAQIKRAAPGGEQSHSLAVTLHELGRVKLEQQDMQAAESLLQESVKITRAIPGGEQSSSLAVTLHALGRVKYEQQDMQAAEFLFKECAQIERAAAWSLCLAWLVNILKNIQQLLSFGHGALRFLRFLWIK